MVRAPDGRLTGLFMGVGYLIGGAGGMMIALAIAAGTNLFSYWNADKMVLSMNGALEVDEKNAPEFYGSSRTGPARRPPMPKVYLTTGAAERLRHRPQSQNMRRSRLPPACCSPCAARNSRP